MRMFGAFVFAVCSISLSGAQSTSDNHRLLTIDIDTASFPVLDMFGDPTLSGGLQVWSSRFSSLIGNSQQTTVPIVQDAGAIDPFTAYVYRRGCKIGYYEVKNATDDSLHRKFRCEPAGEKPITVTIENFDSFHADGLFAWISYAGPWGCYYDTSDSICSLQTVRFTVGVFPIASNGQFTFPMPDFGNDQNLSRITAAHLGVNFISPRATIGFTIRPLRGATLGDLVLGETQSGRALQVAQDYPDKISMTFVPQR